MPMAFAAARQRLLFLLRLLRCMPRFAMPFHMLLLPEKERRIFRQAIFLSALRHFPAVFAASFFFAAFHAISPREREIDSDSCLRSFFFHDAFALHCFSLWRLLTRQRARVMLQLSAYTLPRLLMSMIFLSDSPAFSACAYCQPLAAAICTP